MTIITKYSHTTHIAPDKFTTVSLGAEPRPRPRPRTTFKAKAKDLDPKAKAKAKAVFQVW